MQGHIAQAPLCFLSDVDSSVEVGIVSPAGFADEKTLSLTPLRSIKLESKHGDVFSVLPDKLAFSQLGFVRESPVRLDWNFDATTQTMNGNLEEPEGFALLEINQVVAKAEGSISQCLLLVGRVN